jgi:hypothetical protein
MNRIAMALGMIASALTLNACSGGGDGGGGGTTPPPPVTVASVSVSPSDQTLAPQQTAQLTATVKDAQGNTLSGRTVDWSSSQSGTASVSSSGLVTAVAAGTATITATSEGKSGTAQVTVTAPVATVNVSAPSTTLVPTQTLQLSVVLKDQGGATLTGRPVTYTSSAAQAVTVNSSGLVTAVAVGTATITATSEGKNGTIALTVAPGVLVGTAGGTVTAADSSVVVTIPPNALGTDTPISITPVSGTLAAPAAADLAGTAYQIGPSGLTFSQPVTIKLKYALSTLPLWAMSGDLTVMVNSGTGWTPLGGVVVDPVARTVSGTTTSLGSLSSSLVATSGGTTANGRHAGSMARAGVGAGVAPQLLAAGSPAVTTLAVNWASVNLTPASDSVNNQKRSVQLHAGLVPTGVSTTVPAPPGITKPTALWRYRWRTTGQNGTLGGGSNDTGWNDSPDEQYICTNANLDVVQGKMDDVILDILLNPGTENDPANQKIVRKQMSVYAGLKKTFEISPDLATIGPGVTQQMHFIIRDQAGSILPPGSNTLFTWQNSDIAGTLQQSQTEFAGYQAKNTFTSPPPRVDRIDAKVQGKTTVTERQSHWDFSKVIPTLVIDNIVTVTYNLLGNAHTFMTVHVNYTVTLSPANPTVAVDGQPQSLQAVLTPAYNGPGLAYVWSSPGTHGTLSETNGNHSASKTATFTPKTLDQGGTDQVSVKVVSWVANTELETLGTGTANVIVDPFRTARFSARQISVNGGASTFTTATLEIPKVAGAVTYQVQGTVLGAPYTRTFTGATSSNTQSLNQVLEGGSVWYINLDGGYNTIKTAADARYQLYLTNYASSTAKYKALP